MHRLCAFWILVPLLAFQGTAAQEPQPPVFRTGIDLITLDVAVLDSRGAPVTDLQPGDFTVTVAEQPRKVVSALFSGSAGRTGVIDRVAAGDASPAVHAGGAGAGRLVVFVVDRESMQSGSEKALFEGAGTVIDALGPGDAAALAELPGRAIVPTREHERVRAGLRQVTGAMPPNLWRWHVTWEEALGIDRDDKRLLSQVLERECRPAVLSAGMPKTTEACDADVVTQSREMAMIGRSKARATFSSLGQILQGLAPLQGPKHIILLSGGVLFEQGLLTEYNIVARQATEAGVVLHVIHVDQPASDSTTSRRIITSAYGSRELSQGLSTIAGMTAGTFYSGVGSASGVFERIATEIANLYQLGIETKPVDADGKERDIRVTVNRPNLTVRTRPRIVVPTAAAMAARASDPLALLLQQPTDLGGLPIRVASYTTRGDDRDLLRVVVAAEIATGQGTSRGEWAFTILSDGNAVATGRRKVEAASGDPWLITASTKLVPGRYRLRFAAIVSDGRAGVIDVPLTAGLRAAGDLQVSDLVVGTAEEGRLVPRSRIPGTSDVRMMIELMCADTGRLGKSRAVLEIVPVGSAEPVKRFLMGVRTGPADTIVLSEAQVDAGALAPGRYTAHVIVLIDDQPVGRVTRLFETTSPRPPGLR